MKISDESYQKWFMAHVALAIAFIVMTWLILIETIAPAILAINPPARAIIGVLVIAMIACIAIAEYSEVNDNHRAAEDMCSFNLRSWKGEVIDWWLAALQWNPLGVVVCLFIHWIVVPIRNWLEKRGYDLPVW